MTCNLNRDVVITYGGDTIGSIVAFNGLDGSVPFTDVSTFDSAAREFCSGLYDGGQFTVDVIRDFDNVGQVGMADNIGSSTAEEMVITFSVGTINTITFNAFCVSDPVYVSGGFDEVVKTTFKLKVTGLPVKSAV
jgi:hypothetical protein